jgi:hypothetical protein
MEFVSVCVDFVEFFCMFLSLFRMDSSKHVEKLQVIYEKKEILKYCKVENKYFHSILLYSSFSIFRRQKYDGLGEDLLVKFVPSIKAFLDYRSEFKLAAKDAKLVKQVNENKMASKSVKFPVFQVHFHLY